MTTVVLIERTRDDIVRISQGERDAALRESVYAEAA
jgi:hypothetical protein